MRIVTSYINPDLDGVASGLAFATYLAPSAVHPIFVGQPSAEAAGVLDQLALADAITWVSLDGSEWDDVALVDCHHPAQLPHVPDLSKVSVIIDHHPDGDAGSFPNAKIQNERVGAAATLVVEGLIAASRLSSVTPAHAALLASAIASNTLDFEAPSTTDRDFAAYTALARLAAPAVAVDELRDNMRKWRQGFLALSTREALEQDTKLIETRHGLVVVAQLEGDNASALADRLDILDRLSDIVAKTKTVAGLVSLVDTAANSTTLITTDHQVRRALLTLKPRVVDDERLVLPFIALRKTHLIPALTSPK